MGEERVRETHKKKKKHCVQFVVEAGRDCEVVMVYSTYFCVIIRFGSSVCTCIHHSPLAQITSCLSAQQQRENLCPSVGTAEHPTDCY